MEPNEQNQEAAPRQDQDVQFERLNETTTDNEESGGLEPEKISGLETTLPTKEDTMGSSDFPPLTEKEKQPKLENNERIDEMNRKTSIGD